MQVKNGPSLGKASWEDQLLRLARNSVLLLSTLLIPACLLRLSYGIIPSETHSLTLLPGSVRCHQQQRQPHW